jgi:hypothetical protein
MTYSYTLLVTDDDGNSVVDHELTPDQAVTILVRALAEAQFEREAPETVKPVNEKPKKKRKQRTCSVCGKPGHIAKTCPGDETSKSDPLTEEGFATLKGVQLAPEFHSKDFAQAHGVSVAEVNRAALSGSYDEYRNF